MRTAALQASRQGAGLLVAAPLGRSVHVAARKLIVCEGERQQQGEASTSQPAAPPRSAAPSVRVPGQQLQQRRPPPGPYGENTNVKIEQVEKLGESRFSGVVALDSGETPNDWGRVALLVGGDAAAMLLFASIGRVSHGEGLSLGGALSTAWPFLVGWFAAASLSGGYGREAQGGRVGPALGAAAKSWAVGIPAGVLLRSAARGYLPDPTFIGISMVANGVFLLGWRAALAAATPEGAGEPGSAAEALKGRKDRQGNPFEMVRMLFSMVKRW